MKTTDFLKKYSLINNKFIDDFYSFYRKVPKLRRIPMGAS